LGRKSIAETYFKEIPDDEEEGTWLVLYDFKSKPNPRFWSNLKGVKKLTGAGSLVQYSVFMTENKRGALTVVKLARHYGGKVLLYKVEKINV